MRAAEPRRARVEERTPAKRTQKSFAIAVIVVVVAVLSYSLYAMVSPGLVIRFSESAVARHGSIELSSRGKAIIVRDERVVITPISGIIHFLVPDGEKVAAGTAVAEVRDTAISSSVEANALRIEEELDKFVQEAALREGREKDRLLAIRVQIALKEEELKAYVDRKDAKNANKVHSELEQLHKREAAAEAEVGRIVFDTQAAAAAIAEAKRQSDAAAGRALAVLRSCDASLISYVLIAFFRLILGLLGKESQLLLEFSIFAVQLIVALSHQIEKIIDFRCIVTPKFRLELLRMDFKWRKHSDPPLKRMARLPNNVST